MIPDRRRMVAKLASAVQRLNLIAPVDWLKRIDQWRRRQPNLPTRSEAIRTLVERGLEAEARGEKKCVQERLRDSRSVPMQCWVVACFNLQWPNLFFVVA